MTPLPVLVVLPLGTAFVLLLVFAYRRYRADQARKTALTLAMDLPLPEGALSIGVPSTGPVSVDRSGRIMLVLSGTFAENLGSNLLALLARCGLDRSIGSVLLIELDVRRRDHFMAGVPACYHDRIVTASFAGLAGGLANRPPEEVAALIDRWGGPVIAGAERVCEVHQRFNRGEEPALILTFISQGGQAILGTRALTVITRAFPLAQAFGFTALPTDDILRERVMDVLDSYRAVGVRGFVVADNLVDELRNDFGMIGAIVGFASAAENADAAVEQNNAWYRLYANAPGNLVSFSTYARNLPGFLFQPHPDMPPRFFVYKDSVVSAFLTGLEEVRHRGAAIAGANLSAMVPKTTSFDLVLAAVVPEDLKQDEDAIILARQLKEEDLRNRQLVVASIATEIDPERPLCPVAVVSLRALADGPALLRQITTTALPDTWQIPLPVATTEAV